MSIFQDRQAKRFVCFLAAFCGGLLLAAAASAGFFAYALRAALFEREWTMTAALLEQKVSPAAISSALLCTQRTDAAQTLLAQLGRTASAPFWLIPEIRRQAFKWFLAALFFAGILIFAILSCTLRFLKGRCSLYQEATAAITCFADGDFRRHLPRAQTGALYQLFGAVEQLATALQAKSEAEHRSREFLKSMISDISHQLKTPLAALQMYTDIIAGEPENEPAVRSFAAKSLASLARMESLIGSLLKIARLDAGSIVFAPKRVPAAELAAQAAEPLQTRAAREGKRLLLSGSPSLALFCDPEWTAEAVGNLIKNALDHTGEGDEITVFWESSPAMARLTVADTGEGIAPSDFHHIFKRFYRSPSAKGSQGAGLGLPLARAVIEGQGGILSVQSEPQKGAVFTISLPLLTEL